MDNAAYDSGGGAYYGTLKNCVLGGNQALLGGGANRSTLINCLLTNNLAGAYGGGVYYGALTNCTVGANSAYQGGGVYTATLNNCILYYNTAKTGSNYYNAAFNCCCTSPLPLATPGSGNFTNEPLFIDLAGGNLRLQSDSPCINGGKNSYLLATTDLAGDPRISGGTVDLGAYEYPNPSSRLSYAWLRQYGLPTDGSADMADTDKDTADNWHEWIAGTDPIDAESTLRMLSVANSPSGLVVAWSSVTDRFYSLERATTLPSFSVVATNIIGLPTSTIFTDADPPPAPVYYRVQVQR
jgi:hypothetical protein